MAITVFLDPAAMPARTQDQETFDSNNANLYQQLPVFGAQVNATAASMGIAASGGANKIPYKIDLTSTAMTDPGAGWLRFNASAQNAATALAVDLIGSDGVDYSGPLSTFSGSTSAVLGQIRIEKLGDATKYLLLNLSSVATPTGYRQLTVTGGSGSSASPFGQGDPVSLSFTRTGDKGDAGTVTPVLWVRDERASGTIGGSAAANTYFVRTLNTVKKNSISGASLANNQITLPAGTYRIQGVALVFSVGVHQAYLYNVTDGALAIAGTPGLSNTTAQSDIGKGDIVLTSTKVFELRHFTNTNTSNGAGYPASSGQGEVYSELYIEKVS